MNEPMNEPKFDMRAIVDLFGGPQGLVDVAMARGRVIQIKTIYKWLERDSASSHSLAILASLAKMNHITLDITRFVR